MGARLAPPAIAKLLDASGAHLGTAFAVSPIHALTAFHCVGDIEGRIAHQNVQLEFSSARRVSASLQAGDHLADYALLRMGDGLPGDVQPIPLVARTTSGEPFVCGGYPSNIKGPDILYVGGEVRWPESSIFGGVNAIQLYCPEAAANAPLGGFSGAPVLVKNARAAVGLVRWNPPQPTSPQIGLGGMVFCCPSSLIADNQRDVAELIVPLDPADSVDAPLSQRAVSDEDRRLLEVVHEVLARERGAAAHLAGLESEWMKLPGWGFELPIGDKTEQMQRLFIVIVARTLSLALQALIPNSLAETQTLIVSTLRIEGKMLHLSLWCPHQEVIAYLLDHTPPRMSAEQWYEDIRASGADVIWDCEMYPGLLTPIVFVYQPKLRQMRVTNANHRSNPDQFLTPRRCTSTSNFLNFLSSFSLRLGHGPNVILLDNVDMLIDAGVDQWLAWWFHYMTTGNIFDPDLIYISTRDPERFVFQTTTTTGGDRHPSRNVGGKL
jgi:hypothetical protein